MSEDATEWAEPARKSREVTLDPGGLESDLSSAPGAGVGGVQPGSPGVATPGGPQNSSTNADSTSPEKRPGKLVHCSQEEMT